jgi:hypothetical protein
MVYRNDLDSIGRGKYNENRKMTEANMLIPNLGKSEFNNIFKKIYPG